MLNSPLYSSPPSSSPPPQHRSPAAKAKKPVKKVAPPKAAPTVRSHSSIFYAECDKGKLVQEVLVRWWYAISWPGQACQESPGPHYDSMKAFPGVFICVGGDEVGKILDKRDKSTCPNFTNMCKKSAKELKELAVKAIENQKIALEEAGEKGCPDDENLDDVLKWVKGLQEGALDREATKCIKEYNLKL